MGVARAKKEGEEERTGEILVHSRQKARAGRASESERMPETKTVCAKVLRQGWGCWWGEPSTSPWCLWDPD